MVNNPGNGIDLTMQDLEREHKWLCLGAIEKANSVLVLTQRLNVRTVLEVGSGTGALLEALDKLHYAERYYALEPSQSMHDFMRERISISRLVDSQAQQLHESEYARSHVDLAILSHVLEHLENPAALLIETLGVAEYVLVEVPLDGSVLGRLRAKIRTQISGVSRYNNVSGHIQFFSYKDVQSLVHWCGGEIISRRLYVPGPQLQQAMRSGSFSRRLYFSTVWIASRCVGAARWARLYHGHCAVLVRRRSGLESEHTSRHSSVYFASAHEEELGI